MDQDLILRFWMKVDKNGPKIQCMRTQCWVWTASTTLFGYGQLSRGSAGAGNWLAHRLSWMIHRGPIPKNKLILHRCDNPACVRLGHLFLGTRRDNVVDMDRKGRRRSLRGEQSPHAKLTEETVRAIRTEYTPGLIGRFNPSSQSVLAKRYGVSAFTISKIIRGEKWAHVKA